VSGVVETLGLDTTLCKFILIELEFGMVVPGCALAQRVKPGTFLRDRG